MASNPKQTVIIIPNDKSERAGLSTTNRRWIGRMEKLEAAGKAEEVESSVEGAREWELDQDTIRMPFARKARTWTKAQRAAARERLAAVREAVAGSKAKKAKPKTKAKAAAEEEDVKTVKKGKATKAAPAAPAKKLKAKAKPVEVEDDIEIEDEDLEDEVDDEVDDEDEDEEEIVVRRPTKGKKVK